MDRMQDMQFYDRTKFYDAIRSTLPTTGALSTGQVAGFEKLLGEGESRNVNTEWIAYILATAWHETGTTMEPVRETFATTDAQAIATLDRMYGNRPASSKYWTNGFFGRGYVQLTWEFNYKTMGDWLGIDLVSDPSKALDPTIASKIAYEGMLRGMFTGKKLSDYIDTTFPSSTNAEFLEFLKAREIINGTDKATLVANYAETIRKALSGSEIATPVSPIGPTPIPSPVPQPPKPAPKPVPLPPAPTPPAPPPKPIHQESMLYVALAVPALTVLHAFQSQNDVVQGAIILVSVVLAYVIANKIFIDRNKK